MIPAFPATSQEFTTWVPAWHFIAGEWRESRSAKATLPVLNPRYGKPISHVVMGGRDDVDSAVAAAAAAFDAWRKWPIRDRAQVFHKLRELMHKHLVELSWLVSHENGKLYAEAEAEVLKAIECVEYGCSLPNEIDAGKLEVSRGVTCESVYEPLGVVAGAVPFNFPLMVPMWILPQALVGGNTFVLKPSERVPLSSLRLAQLLGDAGLPAGVLNLVQGGREVVEALCDHAAVKAFGFVGSTQVAKATYARATATGKRALCLGGAKNHLIVVPDADASVAVDNIVASFTGCAGQRCMAASVLVAVGDVDHILERVKQRAAALVVGKDIGPVTTAASVQRIGGFIDSAERSGGKVVLDGRRQKADAGGHWIGPTILDHMTPDMPAAQEEIFGPVLTIVRVPTLERAIEVQNRSPYGNASSVYTQSRAVAQRVMEGVQAGMCGVNVGVPVPREPFGFGGWNDSLFGHGNITGWDGFRFWTRQRKITAKWALQKDHNWMS